jgi:ketosteroid isomerase-like protein
MQNVEANKKVARQFIDGITAGDVDAMMNCLHEDGSVETMGTTLISGVNSKKTVRALAAHVQDAFPKGIKMTVHNLIGENDTVAVEAESMAMHSSGKTYNNKYHFLFRFRDGKIIYLKEYLDTEHVTDVLCGGQRPTAGKKSWKD